MKLGLIKTFFSLYRAMLSILLVIHWTTQKLLGYRVGDSEDTIDGNVNNCADIEPQIQAESTSSQHQSYPSTSNTSKETLTHDGIHGWKNLPFLSDVPTVEFLRRSHTIFIMRGLPGSGKSTLVKKLQETYPGSVVCSADHYFTDNDGNYNFDQGKLSVAHAECQQKAMDECTAGSRFIIIDNTNIQVWTMAYYLSLAQYSQYYHCILVEPQTPWRYNVDELARRNIHNVEKDLIARKVKLIQDQKVVPLYYGWFLTRDDSAMLINKANEVLRICSEVLPNGIEVDYIVNGSPQEILLSLDENFKNPMPMLHCTAKYVGSSAKNPYHHRPIVQQSLGKKFTMNISGFLFTESSICALVDLRSSFQGSNDSNTGTNDMLDILEKSEEEFLRMKHKDDVNRKNYDQFFFHGCSTHITICVAKMKQSKQSGEDVLEVCERDYLGKSVSKNCDFGRLTAYAGNMYKATLNQQIRVDCLFQGFYSTRGHR